jgi:hypothetical protein
VESLHVGLLDDGDVGMVKDSIDGELGHPGRATAGTIY